MWHNLDIGSSWLSTANNAFIHSPTPTSTSVLACDLDEYTRKQDEPIAGQHWAVGGIEEAAAAAAAARMVLHAASILSDIPGTWQSEANFPDDEAFTRLRLLDRVLTRSPLYAQVWRLVRDDLVVQTNMNVKCKYIDAAAFHWKPALKEFSVGLCSLCMRGGRFSLPENAILPLWRCRKLTKIALDSSSRCQNALLLIRLMGSLERPLGLRTGGSTRIIFTSPLCSYTDIFQR
ncbi:uncharacterized protein MYCFIDRAFT_176290 [Pseudocercospora fijiensis CIRAD86]|uniref:Uncharacterized protein n=1 Tax=Pseudocercospora fijiensis (strain CIRAD86) TaxID=383855 RepID=M3AUV7_PSEFD|nr:uncharacterized protein MYCFIDRAFT_176290 [Pseudocercospora fijiensis CIRAD86]EME80938.1 hypothetical protein MYCFIDRAFT_176290 [Pseudocercospora fijiensis CIRAD86]